MTADANRGLFVTGTDTDVGKTFIARLLIQGFAPRLRVTYMKPVQTGCFDNGSGTIIAPDFAWVTNGTSPGMTDSDDQVPYCFLPACSPHLAAAMAGVTISFESIRAAYGRLSSGADLTVVEGAGGVLAPLSESASIIDLIKALELPTVVVTSPRLGTLNHTMLTAAALAARDIPLLAVVVNNAAGLPRDTLYRDNVRYLRDHLPRALFLEVGMNQKCTKTVKEFCNALYERLFDSARQFKHKGLTASSKDEIAETLASKRSLPKENRVIS